MYTVESVTSTVTIHDNVVTKRIWKLPKHQNQHTYKCEIYSLKFLNDHGFDWCPKLIETNDSENTFTMTYCGTPMTNVNRPDDYKEQALKIYNDMQSIGMCHRDIKLNKEVLILNGKVHIVDFGWATIKGVNFTQVPFVHKVNDEDFLKF